MINELVLRKFSDATFVFDPKSGKSLFVEGTIADLVHLFLKRSDWWVPKSYVNKIQSKHQLKAKEEIKFLRKTVSDFLIELKDNKISVLESESNETPVKKFLDYAIKRWQIVNASIELNNNCNLQCRCCYAESTKRAVCREVICKK